MKTVRHRKPARHKASDTRGSIVDAARELFYARGFQGTSLVEVAEVAGVHGGSIYHFFATKDRLVEAVLERYLELLGPMIMDPVRTATTDPRARVLRLLAGYRAHLIATRFRRGCPIGMLALELTEEHPEARRLIAANFEAWRGTLAEMLSEGAQPRKIDCEAAATFVLTVMEGAVMQAMTHRNIKPFDASVDQLDRYLQTLFEHRSRS